MSFLDKIFGNNKKGNNQKKCSRCGRPMKLAEYGKTYDTMQLMNTQGCFECKACGKLTCFDCSDNRYPCECGAKQWIERSYFLR